MSSRLLWATAVVLSLVLGCADNGVNSGSPEIDVSIDEINMCLKEPGTAFRWEGFEISNSGDENLIISNIEIRGDKSCAFRCFREHADTEAGDRSYPCAREEDRSQPFQMTVPPGSTRLVRIDYTASNAGVTDMAALVITSNAENHRAEGSTWGQLVIPMCGAGYSPENAVDAGADGGVGQDAGGELTEQRPDCPICATVEKGSPGCEE